MHHILQMTSCTDTDWLSSFKQWNTTMCSHKCSIMWQFFYSHILTLYNVRHEWLLE